MRRYVVEAIGTFFLVAAAIGGGGLAAGFMLMAMIFAGGHISGGHFNPAVSVAVFVRGRLSTADLLPYVGAQLLGALAAGLLGGWIRDFTSVGRIGTFSGAVIPQAFIVETVVTFALAWTVLNVATSKDHPNNHFYGLAIGAVVVGGGVAFGAFTGGAFNPAVGFGATLAGAISWANIWVYLVGCTIGGAIAGYAFNALNPDDVDAPAPAA
jgi:aquaporin Z